MSRSTLRSSSPLLPANATSDPASDDGDVAARPARVRPRILAAVAAWCGALLVTAASPAESAAYSPSGRAAAVAELVGPVGPASLAGHVGHLGHVGQIGYVGHVGHVGQISWIQHGAWCICHPAANSPFAATPVGEIALAGRTGTLRAFAAAPRRPRDAGVKRAGSDSNAVAVAVADADAGRADAPVHYRVLLPDPQTQMVDFEVDFPAVGDGPVELVLPTWRPGRYEILDPAGTLREMEAWAIDPATGERGRSLAVTKTGKSHWRIEPAPGRGVRVAYRAYANSIRDRTRHVDDSHAFLSPSSCFVYQPVLRQHPVTVTVEAPDDWRIATGMPFADGRTDRVVADDYDILVDSPLEIGRHDLLEFEVGGKPHEIVIWPPDLEYDADRLVADFTGIIESTVEIFGRMPYERYVFLIQVGAGGGGTEHLNSTIMMTSRGAMTGSFDSDGTYDRLLGLTAHEYFHTWNVKQFRPAGIKPYDYERENYTPLLWVAEGTTSYYDELIPVRAGLETPKEYLSGLARTIGRERDRPGRLIQDLEASSFDAWVKFNRSTPDSVNCTVSFYSKGALASLLLDLELRRRTDGTISLDDVMRELFVRFPYEERGFTTTDLVTVLEELSDSEFDAFFASYIAGTEQLPLEEAFEVVGCELFFEPASDDAEDTDDADEPDADDDDDAPRRTRPEDAPRRPWIGLDLSSSNGRTIVRSVRSDGPAYQAGLIANDEILALDGLRLGAGDLDARLERRTPGETVRITYFRRDELRTIEVPIGSKPDGRWVLRRVDEPTEAQEAQWRSWVGG